MPGRRYPPDKPGDWSRHMDCPYLKRHSNPAAHYCDNAVTLAAGPARQFLTRLFPALSGQAQRVSSGDNKRFPEL